MIWFNIVGLASEIAGSIMLLLYIFVSDEEIEEYSNLPIEKSTSNMTTEDSTNPKPVAVIDPDLFKEHRVRYIEYRRKERRNGRIGLALLIFGFVLQLLYIVIMSCNTR